MNILILNQWSGVIGGSQHTTLSIAKELSKRGHKIVYACPDGPLAEVLKRLCIRYYPWRCEYPVTKVLEWSIQFSPLSAIELYRIVKKEKIDCIHTFQHLPFMTSYLVGGVLGVPAIHSFIGPIDTITSYSKIKSQMIALCEEFRDGAVEKYGVEPGAITVLRNRIDTQMYRPGIDSSSILRRFAFSPDSKKIVMLSTFFHNKLGNIKDLLNATPYIVERGQNVQTIICGDGPHFQEISTMAREINSKIGRRCVILTGLIRDVPQMLNLATVVVGVGRSALEGMACGKPTVVLGERGFAGIVSPETINKLAHYNFAGRNVPKHIHISHIEAADAITRLLLDGKYSQYLGNFALEYIRNEFDVRVGADQLERRYRSAQENTNTSRRGRTAKIASWFSNSLIILSSRLHGKLTGKLQRTVW